MDKNSLASYIESYSRTLVKCYAEWSRVPPEEWAENVYRLPNGGRFRWSFAPYARAMFRSMFEPATIETNLMLYSRGLKSTVVLIAIGYIIDQAPRRILSLWPTNSNGEKFSKDILDGELFSTTPCLNYLSTVGQRKNNQTLLHKTFPGGLIDIFGANAPGDMRRAKGSFLYADEIDAIGSEQTDEGDQLAIFNKRGSEYPDAIRVFASYPSLKGYSRIQTRLDATDYNEWFSTCVKCGGEPFVMHRNQIIFEPDSPEQARLQCPRCKELLTDADRYEMAHRQGFDNWKPRHPFKGRRGYHGNALLWPHPSDPQKLPGGALQMIAQQQIEAEASENPRRAIRVVVNTVDAEPFDPVSETEQPPNWRKLYDAREDYGLLVPAGGLFITAFVDCQLNRLEVGWRAWGREDRSWGMDHVVIDGHVRDREVWQLLRTELSRQWIHANGGKLPLGMAFVDGGHYAENVYSFMQELARNPVSGVTGRCRASKGIGQFAHPIIDRKWKTVAKNLKGYHIGTWEAKDRIYEWLRMDDSPMKHNRRFSEEYFQQLTVEKVSIEYEGGDEIRSYDNEKNERNEALDLEVGNLAAWRLHPRNFETLEAQLENSIPRIESADEPPLPPRPARKEFGFAMAATKRWL